MFNIRGKKYICYPFVFGEGVKFVLQIICEDNKEYNELKEKLEEVRRYIESIIPVLEAKRLLANIRERDFKDPTTQLYN